MNYLKGKKTKITKELLEAQYAEDYLEGEREIELVNKYFHDRNTSIDRIMDCIGMITRVAVIE